MTTTVRYFRTMGLSVLGYVLVTLVFFGLASLDGDEPGPGMFIGLAVWKIGFITVSVLQAREKGRNPVLWGIIELLSSVIGTIVLLLLPYTKEKTAALAEHKT